MMRLEFAAIGVVVIAAAACGPAVEISGELRTAESLEAPDAGPVQTPRARPDAGPRNPNCPDPTLTAIRDKIFVPHCGTGSCHTGPAPAMGLDLTMPVPELAARLTEPAMQSVSGLALVAPGQYGASWLYLKVFLETPGSGAQMPPSQHLDECAVGALRDWIQAGAPN